MNPVSWVRFVIGAAAALGLGFAGQPYTTWKDYAGGSDSMQYSALRQINRKNVNRLELAWFRPSQGANHAFNPIIVDGTMYVLDGNGAISALDASSGKQIWTHPWRAIPPIGASTIGRARIAATGG
jgi:quinoprotein glucose dehydrogenase